MSTWILILALVGADGFVRQIESVGPFATHDACNDAGVIARAELPSLLPPGPWQRSAWHRIDWVCVAAGGATIPTRAACDRREAAIQRLRDEFAKGERCAAAATNLELCAREAEVTGQDAAATCDRYRREAERLGCPPFASASPPDDRGSDPGEGR